MSIINIYYKYKQTSKNNLFHLYNANDSIANIIVMINAKQEQEILSCSISINIEMGVKYDSEYVTMPSALYTNKIYIFFITSRCIPHIVG